MTLLAVALAFGLTLFIWSAFFWRRMQCNAALLDAVMEGQSLPRSRRRRASGPNVIDGGREVPLSVAREETHEDPLLESMIKKDLPLCRDTYLMLSYGPELPDEEHWNAKHEMGLPRCFQRPLNRPRTGRKPE